MSDVPREKKFFHCAGKSETKNTAVVVEAWRTLNIPFPLTVSAFKPDIVRFCVGTGCHNIRHVQRFSDEELKREMNAHQYFILPSRYEGYGVALSEASQRRRRYHNYRRRANEKFPGVPKELLIPVARTEPRHLAVFSHVDYIQTARKVMQAAALTPAQIQTMSEQARAGFLAGRDEFRKNFAAFMETIE